MAIGFLPPNLGDVRSPTVDAARRRALAPEVRPRPKNTSLRAVATFAVARDVNISRVRVRGGVGARDSARARVAEDDAC
jgi:hypothetical protein